MPWIDTHLHLADEKMEDVDALVSRSLEADVTKLVVICTGREDVERALKIQEQFPEHIFLVGGTTPHQAETLGVRDFDFFKEHAEKGTFVALGESGLDYYYEHSDRGAQKKWLREYLRLSNACNLPLVIHCRNAFDDFFSILDDEGGNGVLHCFTGNLQEAKGVIDRGWYISFSGIVTFKRSHELQEVAKAMPLDRIVIETDSPYLAPQSKRGKQNEPSYLPEVGECVARLKGVSVEEVQRLTWENGHKLYKIS